MRIILMENNKWKHICWRFFGKHLLSGNSLTKQSFLITEKNNVNTLNTIIHLFGYSKMRGGFILEWFKIRGFGLLKQIPFRG